MDPEPLVEVLADLAAHPPVAQQADGVTYAAKIAKDEYRLDFSRPADALLRQVLAFNPPGAWFEVAGERIRLLAAVVEPDRRGDSGLVLDEDLTIACAEGAIRPTLVQRAGRAAMAPADLLRGFPIPPGTRL